MIRPAPTVTPPKGYRMPAEWEKHEATWLAWPHNLRTWPESHLRIVRETYFRILEALTPREHVHLLVQNTAQIKRLTGKCRKRRIKMKNLIFHAVATADAWIRDYGPIFLRDRRGAKAWTKWTFNAWGGKDAEHFADNKVFGSSQKLVPLPCFFTGMILEGGSVDVNGKGACLVTESCLLNPNRNTQFSRSDVEEKLRNYLGVTEVVWLAGGLAGDDTDGHVDNIARFTAAKTVVAVFEPHRRDAHYPALNENWRRLSQWTEEKGKGWRLARLPLPARSLTLEKKILPASYANFYIANETVLVPSFNDPHDTIAAGILTELFPGRKIVSIDCRALVTGGGSLHCITQQEPA